MTRSLARSRKISNQCILSLSGGFAATQADERMVALPTDGHAVCGFGNALARHQGISSLNGQHPRVACVRSTTCSPSVIAATSIGRLATSESDRFGDLVGAFWWSAATITTGGRTGSSPPRSRCQPPAGSRMKESAVDTTLAIRTPLSCANTASAALAAPSRQKDPAPRFQMRTSCAKCTRTGSRARSIATDAA